MIDFSPLFEAIAELGGRNCAKTLKCLEKVGKNFKQLDNESFKFCCANENVLRERMKANKRAFTDNEPSEKAIIVYFDLSTSVELLNYILHIGQVINEILGSNEISKIRFSELSVQHATAFVETAGKKLSVTNSLLEKVRSKYESILESFFPFNIVVMGPHLTATGGIILECQVYSQQFFDLRKFAKADDSLISKVVRLRKHDIIHSTLGYITEATTIQMQSLYYAFQSISHKNIEIPVRVREARIITTRNKKLIHTPLRVSFKGSRRQKLSNQDIMAKLQRINELANQWSFHPIMRNFVWEEAIYWAESGEGSGILHEAYKILMKCKLQSLALYEHKIFDGTDTIRKPNLL